MMCSQMLGLVTPALHEVQPPRNTGATESGIQISQEEITSSLVGTFITEHFSWNIFMKNKLAAVIISAISMVSAPVFSAVSGETSTVNFTGKVIQATCSLDTASKNQTVIMDDVPVNFFSGAGSYTSSTDFDIGLENCDTSVAQTATVTFSGSTADDVTLETSDIATTKVGLQILQDGSPLKLDGSTASAPVTLTDGTSSLPFAARYISMDDAPAAGDANATANFTLSYQ